MYSYTRPYILTLIADEWSAPGEMTSGTNLIGGQVVPELWRRENLCPCQELNPDSSHVQPVA
jgi:hypothetical protein